mmetsp:Transcript_41719/g.87540  ORF Transcript_41719/g.87540 Transcript_41719/m.87540 type:complete len:204 (-) Transcript_41719:253-864(-)
MTAPLHHFEDATTCFRRHTIIIIIIIASQHLRQSQRLRRMRHLIPRSHDNSTPFDSSRRTYPTSHGRRTPRILLLPPTTTTTSVVIAVSLHQYSPQTLLRIVSTHTIHPRRHAFRSHRCQEFFGVRGEDDGPCERSQASGAFFRVIRWVAFFVIVVVVVVVVSAEIGEGEIEQRTTCVVVVVEERASFRDDGTRQGESNDEGE